MNNSSTSGTFAEAVIDLAAVAHNTRLLAGRARGRLMAVVKADGFGHGMVPVARTTLANGADWLGVTSCAEALRLRAEGIDAPVLTWMHLPDEDFAPAITAGVDLTVASREHLEGIAASARRAGRTAWIHLKVDTGLARNGADPDDWPDLVAAARREETRGRVRVRGVWSHLATAEEPDDPTVGRQIRLFEWAVGRARAAGLRPRLRHLANSAAALGIPRAHFDLVRAGIALYGGEHVPDRTWGLRPALTLSARAIMVRRVPPGTGVSYGHTYRTDRETTLVLVPVGFADGVPRAASNRGEVLVGGERRPIVGRVAMDQFVVDAGDLPVGIGTEVVLLGPGDRGEPTVAEWSRWADTNPHEILTGIGARVGRRYLDARPASHEERRYAVV